MASSDYVYGNKQWEINRWILSLSTIGLASKVLKVDLSSLSVFGLNLGEENTSLLPGFICVALIYAFMSYLVARIENFLANWDSTSEQVAPLMERLSSHRTLKFAFYVLSVVPFLLYTVIPIFLSLFTIYVLHKDMNIVVQHILKSV